MSLLVTDAVVLHAFDYLETSRILRLATREAGVQSVLARGARRSRSRYGSALDLFAGGVAEIHTRTGRELQTLASFDVTRPRTALALDLDRFTAASAIAELMMRFARDDAHDSLFEALLSALERIEGSAPGMAIDAALAGAWHLIAELGFAPAVEHCTSCHTALGERDAVRFSHPAGGALCDRCAPLVRASRLLPAEAVGALRRWIAGETAALDDEGSRRAHQRLLREFLQEHLADGRPLRAFDVWEREQWGAA